MRGKKVKAIRKLATKRQKEETRYVGQDHLIPDKESPEMNHKRTTVLATGLRRTYQDSKRTIKEKKL